MQKREKDKGKTWFSIPLAAPKISYGIYTLDLDDTELGFLQDGFSSITIGDAANGSGSVDVASSTFSDPVTIVGGSIAATELDAGSNAVTLTARTGDITDGGDVASDITGGPVNLTSAGNIAASGDAITVNSTSLSTNTNSTNGNQFLSASSSTSISSLSAGTGTISLVSGTFVSSSNNVIADNATLNVSSSAVLDLNGFIETIDGLSGTGTVNNSAAGTASLSVGNANSDSTFSGTLQDTGGDLSLIKLGNGRLVLTSANTYAGTTTVSAGVLFVNGSITSNVTVNSGTTLGGSGTINSGNSLTVNSGGTVAPGNSPGILNSGNVAFASGST